jgi:Protein of unknown function (DUF3592)
VGFFFGLQGPSYQALMTLLNSRTTYFLMIGLGLLLGAWFVAEDQYLRNAPTTFRKTTCVVNDVDVRVLNHNRRGAPTSFAPVITFTFTADGREYEAAGYRLYEGGMGEDEADEIADRYEPGQQTFCYYDPANPDHAVLSLEGDQHSLGLLVVLSILLLAGGLTGWIFLEYVVKSAAPKPPASLKEMEESLRTGRLAAGTAGPSDLRADSVVGAS